jgi:hypothetical protein
MRGQKQRVVTSARTRQREDLFARYDAFASGDRAARQLRSVVFHACVPPATMMLSPAAATASRKRAACTKIVPSATSSSNELAVRMLVSSLRTRRATKTRPGSLIQISSTSGRTVYESLARLTAQSVRRGGNPNQVVWRRDKLGPPSSTLTNVWPIVARRLRAPRT